MVGIDELDSRSSRASWQSPLANALPEYRVGDVVTLRTPQGRSAWRSWTSAMTA